MATSRRLPSTLALATKTSTTPYICASCRSQAPISSIPSQPSQIRHNSNLPFTERLRRRIWGTDNPPGLKDPYGGPSFLERRLAERRGEQVSRQESQPTQLEEPSSEVPAPMRREAISPKRQAVETRAPVVKEPKPYEEATTWRGLKWIGETGSYRHMPRTEADDYEPWIKTKGRPRRLPESEIWEALHEAIFDAVQPEDDAYSNTFPIAVSPSGFVTAMDSEAQGTEVMTFANAKLGFNDSSSHIFKIMQNFQSLTSFRIPDPLLNNLARKETATYTDFVAAILELQKPKPAKINDHLVANEQLMSQSNVKVVAHKTGSIRREKDLGRWKVIEKELLTRGLPVPGMSGAEKSKALRRHGLLVDP